MRLSKGKYRSNSKGNFLKPKIMGQFLKRKEKKLSQFKTAQQNNLPLPTVDKLFLDSKRSELDGGSASKGEP